MNGRIGGMLDRMMGTAMLGRVALAIPAMAFGF